jgi:PhnB protein
MPMPDGRIGYAEIKIGDSLVLLSDEFPEMGAQLGPKSLKGSSTVLQLYVDDAEQVIEQAITAGATIIRPLQDQFFGDRACTVEDPFGHRWNIATRQEEISRTEMLRRFNEMMQQ